MTTSTKQVIANRKNAKKGGVKTKKGKEQSKMNALKHGLLTEAMLLPGEDIEVLADIMTILHEELRPQGQLEEILVDRIISCTWRLQRVIKAETSQILRYYKDHMSDTKKFPTPVVKRWAENSFFNSSCVDTFLRYETTIESVCGQRKWDNMAFWINGTSEAAALLPDGFIVIHSYL